MDTDLFLYKNNVDNKTDVGARVEWLDNILKYQCFDKYTFGKLKSTINSLYIFDSFRERTEISAKELLEEIVSLSKTYDEKIQALKDQAQRDDYKIDFKRNILTQIRQLSAQADAKDVDNLLKKMSNLASNYRTSLNKEFSSEIRSLGYEFVDKLKNLLDENVYAPLNRCI